MSKQYFNFGAGWKRENQNGQEYISCKANSEANDKGNVRIQAVNESGEVVDIESFVVLPNDKKTKDGQPDFRFVFSLES